MQLQLSLNDKLWTQYDRNVDLVEVLVEECVKDGVGAGAAHGEDVAQAVHHHAVRVAHGDEAELLGDDEDGEGEPGEEVDEGDDEEEHVGPLLPAHPPPLGLGVGARRPLVQTQGVFYLRVDPGI